MQHFSEEINGSGHVFANKCRAILLPVLLADNGYLGICQRPSYTLQELPKSFPVAFGISQWLSYTLLAFPGSCPTYFKSISQQLSTTTWQFPSIFSEGPCFCKHLLKVAGANENFKNHQRLLS
jgi:hypothetical protein